jgi:hypothetical protein
MAMLNNQRVYVLMSLQRLVSSDYQFPWVAHGFWGNRWLLSPEAKRREASREDDGRFNQSPLVIVKS